MPTRGNTRAQTAAALIPVTTTVALLLLTLAVRWPFRQRVGFIHDTWWYMSWSETATNRGLGQLYARPDFDYPPIYSYILLGLGHLQRDILHAPFALDNPTMLTLLKVPAITCDMLIVATLFLFLARISSWVVATAGALAYALNPGVIYDSAIWGQVDSVASLPMILSVICLIARRPKLATMFLALAVLTKLQAIVLAPLLLVALYRMGRAREVLAGAAVAAATAIVVITPIALTGQLGKVIDVYVESTRIQPFVSVAAFNLWWSINWLQTGTPQSPIEDSVAFIGPISYKATALMLYGMATLGICWAAARARLTAPTLSLAAAGSVLAFFLLAPEMHERYLFPALPLLLLGITAWLPRLLYPLLSLTFFFNLHWVLQAANRRYWPAEHLTWSVVLALIDLTALACLGWALYRQAASERAAVTAAAQAVATPAERAFIARNPGTLAEASRDPRPQTPGD